jgi:hypothetical protein
MHMIAVGLTTLLLTVAATVSGIAAETNTIEAAETAQLCNYCQDFTDAAMAAGPVRTAYQVGIGYQERVVKLVDAGQAGALTQSPR